MVCDDIITYIIICMYVCKYVCMYVCMCGCMCKCVCGLYVGCPGAIIMEYYSYHTDYSANLHNRLSSSIQVKTTSVGMMEIQMYYTTFHIPKIPKIAD